MTQKQQYSTNNTFTPACSHILHFSEEATEQVKPWLCCNFHSAFPCPTSTWPSDMAVRGSKRTEELTCDTWVWKFNSILQRKMYLICKEMGEVFCQSHDKWHEHHHYTELHQKTVNTGFITDFSIQQMN